VDKDTFRVTTGVQRIANLFVEPVGYVTIRVLEDGVEQRMSRGELFAKEPSSVVDEINATLSNVSLINSVTSEEGADGQQLLVCQLVLTGAFTRGVLARVPEGRLNSVMSWAVSVAMPWFLTKLREDAIAWAADKPRNMSGVGEMGALARQLLSGGGRLPPGVVELRVDDDVAGGAVTGEAPSAAERSGGPPTRGLGFGKR